MESFPQGSPWGGEGQVLHVVCVCVCACVRVCTAKFLGFYPTRKYIEKYSDICHEPTVMFCHVTILVYRVVYYCYDEFSSTSFSVMKTLVSSSISASVAIFNVFRTISYVQNFSESAGFYTEGRCPGIPPPSSLFPPTQNFQYT